VYTVDSHKSQIPLR